MSTVPAKQADSQSIGSTDLRVLPIDALYPDEAQPRSELEAADTTSEFRTLDGLAQSISERGILQPLRVMALPSGGYQILSGHRRHAAAKLAGLTTIPCVILQNDGDAVGQFIDQVTENTQRKSMTSNEMSLAIQKLLQKGLSQTEVSRKLGVNESTVSILIRLHKLAPDIKDAFDKGLIESPRAAYDLGRLPQALQKHILSQVGQTPLTQSAVREAKRAWDTNGLANRHPFHAPVVPAATIALLKSCLEDGRQDQYTRQWVERDRDAFFGAGWRNCVPHESKAVVDQGTKVERRARVKLEGLTFEEAQTFIFALEGLTGGGNPANPLRRLQEPTDEQLSKWINAEIKKVIALEVPKRSLASPDKT